jgi:calcineurin-like phosphoesterase family protein
MQNIFFIGDLHFGHANILRYESEHRVYREYKDVRPFKDIDEHDEYLVSEWNKVVGEKDIVYVLGDFCFGRSNIAIASCLNGRKRLIMGNHDVYPADEYLKHFEKIYGALFYKNYLLTHIPVHPQFARAIINVHGHLHSKLVPNVNSNLIYINVSCEQIGMRPISMDELNLKVYGMRDNF